MINLEQFMTNLKVSLLRKHCFYGHILAQLPIVYDADEVPTLGVGKRNKDEIQVKLFVNPDYVEHIIEECNRDEQKVVNHFTEVLKHEVHHLVFQHLTLDLPDKRRQMIACELADNSYVDRGKLVKEDGQDKPGVFPEDYGLESKLGVHEYYNLLNDNKQFRKFSKKSSESQDCKDLDDLAKKQEQASKDTKSGEDTSDKQSNISEKTQEILDKLSEKLNQSQGQGQDDSENEQGQDDSDQSNSDQDGQDGSNGGSQEGGDQDLKDAVQSLEQARDLQSQAEDALENGDYDKAAKKQHQAAKKIKEAKDSLSQSENAGSGSGDGQGQDGDGMIDSHEKWSPIAGDEMTNGMIKDIVRQANETCKQMNSWGDLPGELQSAIDDAYCTEKEIIPWEVVLKDFLASSSENVLDYTMKRKSKRYDTRPGTKKDDVLNVAIGIDTSGSIDDELLTIFFNELRWIDRTGTKITVFEWDTQVNREYDFKEFDGLVTGRGGTDPTDFLEKVSERKFDCIITFTDFGFGKIEKRYNKPMLWVVDMGCYGSYYSSENFPVEEGIIMKVNDTRDGFEMVGR